PDWDGPRNGYPDGNVEVESSRDNGRSWQLQVINRTAPSRDHEVRLASDQAGNVYAGWVNGDNRVLVMRSADSGRSWQGPFDVTPPDVMDVNSAMIALAAGSPGRMAVTFLATSDAKPADPDQDR